MERIVIGGRGCDLTEGVVIGWNGSGLGGEA